MNIILYIIYIPPKLSVGQHFFPESQELFSFCINSQMRESDSSRNVYRQPRQKSTVKPIKSIKLKFNHAQIQ